MNIKFYDNMAKIARPLCKILFPRSKVIGLENVPAEGGVVICANHCHWFDCVYLGSKIESRRITYLSKAEAMEHPVTKHFLGEKGLGAIPIHRGEADLSAVRSCMQVVKNGDALGIFPQGTRSRDNSPTPMLNGVSMIAVRAAAPIIPVYIDGPYRLFRPVSMHIGAPVDISDLGRKVDSATLTEVTNRIASAIWAGKACC